MPSASEPISYAINESRNSKRRTPKNSDKPSRKQDDKRHDKRKVHELTTSPAKYKQKNSPKYKNKEPTKADQSNLLLHTNQRNLAQIACITSEANIYEESEAINDF